MSTRRRSSSSTRERPTPWRVSSSPSPSSSRSCRRESCGASAPRATHDRPGRARVGGGPMTRRWGLYLAGYPALAISALVMMLPLIWMVATAFKSSGEVLNLAGPFFPTHWQFSNLVAAWEAAPFGRFYLNSIIFTVCATAGQVITSAMSGYAFARFNFPGRDFLFYLTLTG